MRNAIHIYRKSIQMNWRAGLEYKGWWLMVLNVLFNVVTDPLSTILLFSRFSRYAAIGTLMPDTSVEPLVSHCAEPAEIS